MKRCNKSCSRSTTRLLHQRSCTTLLPSLLLLALAPACPPGGNQNKADASTPSDADPGQDAAVVIDDLVESLCAVLTRCSTELGFAFASESECRQYYAQRYNCQTDLNSGNSTAKQQCRQWLEGVSCDDTMMRFGCVPMATPLACGDVLDRWGQLGATACAHVFDTVTAAEGESCADKSCAMGSFCRRGANSRQCPTCVALAGVDQACLDNQFAVTYQPCAQHLYCDNDEDVCKTRKANGTTCARDRECASGFCRADMCSAPVTAQAAADLNDFDQCMGFLNHRLGVCAARVAEGQACIWDYDCFLNAACVDGLCVKFDVCAKRSVGQPCVTEPLGCQDGAFCNNTQDPQQCQNIYQLGDNCEFTEDCGDDAYCSLYEQKCTAYSNVGQSCEGALLCSRGLYCDDSNGSICALQRDDGQSCGYNFECVSDYCDQTSTQCATKPACSMP